MKAGYGIVLLTAALGLSACATTTEQTAAPQRAPSILDPDAEYVARVEAIARRRGIEVQWVNMPRKSARQVEEEKALLQGP